MAPTPLVGHGCRSPLEGAEDPITGGDVARVHHDEIAHSTLTLLDGVGHYPMLEAPERWADALLRALPAGPG
ncbi:MAG: alpha/beta hydrolase [Deltaproteobacteria bacterium]|nr:alpha/beta hydrolase [Deltaproteobacteria bacterium]